MFVQFWGLERYFTHFLGVFGREKTFGSSILVCFVVFITSIFAE